MWLLLALLQAAVLPARPCEAPAEAAVAVRAFAARLLGLAMESGQDADPGIYVGLRLGNEHDLSMEQRYLQNMQDTFQGLYGRSLHAASRPSHGHQHHDTDSVPETGRLALYLLGLRATCPPPDPTTQRFPVTWLKYYLEKDWAGSRHHGHPLTSYYQYSLGVLALCVHHKRVREEVIQRLLVAEQHRRFRHVDGNAVDTEAVAALAFACLEKEKHIGARLAAELQAAVHRAKARLVESQRADGLIGNVFSTPLAMQVFIATNTCRTAYGRAMAALLRHLDSFTSAATMAQALLALNGRSYLSIASMQCQEELGTLTPIFLEPMPLGPHNMTVRLVVECPVPGCPQQLLYDSLVSAPAGASLLDLLRAAPPQGSKNFTFETQDTTYGPFLTSVQGMAARPKERHYWQLLSRLGTSLHMGVADYRPKDGNTVILRLSEW
ncbi:transcobalamin-2 [Centrocercus urophasianus]|uniref:transcobalamin-2 n=1 Tax=Centrocercus urophasianus TaxID=9002 RepID=UPI001C646890|nr:transcobalamin-2 [Centrocercus urophasianus]